MRIDVVIIDDEPKAIDLLSHYINQMDNLVIKKTFRNPLKAFHYLSSEKIELIFLDINMPRLSGLDLFKNLENKPNVIFTTAYAEYAVNGFDLNAVDYLLKPISFSRFIKSVQKVTKIHKELDTSEHLPNDPIYIKSGSIDHKLLWRDIKFLEKKENYVIYHLLDGRRLLCRGTMSDIQKLFPSYMVRVHKTYAVCLYNISSVETNRIIINGSEIPIGRKHKDLFLTRYEDHKLLYQIA